MESVESLNIRLRNHFGFDDTGRSIFRIVWADDEVEKRVVTQLDSGIQLLFPEMMEVKKYPYLQHMHVLERLVVVPDFQQAELGVKTSYEPVWAYKDVEGNPLPPVWTATKLIVDSLYAALGKTNLAKYIDLEKNTTKEGREQQIVELQQELFGNETDAGDALAYKEGIVVPQSYNSGE